MTGGGAFRRAVGREGGPVVRKSGRASACVRARASVGVRAAGGALESREGRREGEFGRAGGRAGGRERERKCRFTTNTLKVVSGSVSAFPWKAKLSLGLQRNPTGWLALAGLTLVHAQVRSK